jgi:hypothetical protein
LELLKKPRMVKIGKTTPIEERVEIVKLLKEYRDVLAFSYDELKVYREDVIQHVIPLKEETKPFRQKLRQINPKLAPLVQQELQKMLEAGIIAQTRHSSWCSNIVDRPFSNGGQLMCHEVFIYVEDIIGSTWVSDTPASNFVSGITAPLRGLIL